MESLLNIKGLQTFFYLKNGILKAVNSLELEIFSGEIVALVGESGSGKSVTALSILRLIPEPGVIVSGVIEYKSNNILNYTEKQMARLRGKEIGLILQDPASALNPTIRVGKQITEVVQTHFRLKPKAAKQQALELMTRVQLPNVERLYYSFPHQLSSGLKQRILIAIALAGRPSLLIADEPTTALDVSLQSQILSLMKQLIAESNISLLLITHDLSIVAEMADRVAVMYAGKIIEQAHTCDLFTKPLHPYTRALLNAVPKIDFSENKKQRQLTPLFGSVPDLMNLPSGCSFHPRCPFVAEECRQKSPEKKHFENDHYVTCFKIENKAGFSE